jgi:serine/threonine-protein kinase
VSDEWEPSNPDAGLDDDPVLQGLAEAILDGTPVDWQAASSGPAADYLAEFRLLAGFADVHRRLEDPLASAAAPSRLEHVQATGHWGPLVLLERIGEGAFGEVFRAWDPRLDREVALKLLRAASSGTDAQLTTTIEEGRLLARVRHPNVVTVFGAERIDGRVGVWTEFIHGRTLTDWMQEHGSFNAEEAAAIGLELSRALSAVHDAGLLHRDIKPQNVKRAEDGRVVLMDFGAGIDGGQPASRDVRELTGTPLYLAPELLMGAPATRQSDVYSLGVLLYYLVTGAHPVTGATIGELLDAHSDGRRRALDDVRPGLPSAFTQVVERALSTDPRARFGNAGALEAALSRLRPRAQSRRRSLAFTAAAALLATAPLTAVLWWDHGETGRVAGSEAMGLERVWTGREVNLEGRISRDGRYLTFNDWTTRRGDLTIRDLLTGETRRLTHDAASTNYAAESLISPDGLLIAFTWWDGARRSTRLIGRDGTNLREVAHDRTEGTLNAWSPDGRYLAVTRLGRENSAEILLLSIATGAIVPIKSTRHRIPSVGGFSPDGRYLLYALPGDSDGGAGGLFAVATDASHELTLVSDSANNSQPIWSPDGRRVVFVSDKSGANGLWSVALADGGAAGAVELVRDGGRLPPTRRLA